MTSQTTIFLLPSMETTLIRTVSHAFTRKHLGYFSRFCECSICWLWCEGGGVKARQENTTQCHSHWFYIVLQLEQSPFCKFVVFFIEVKTFWTCRCSSSVVFRVKTTISNVETLKLRNIFSFFQFHRIMFSLTLYRRHVHLCHILIHWSTDKMGTIKAACFFSF